MFCSATITPPSCMQRPVYRISYVHRVARFRMYKQIRPQTASFIRGFYAILSPDWLAMFSPPELQKLISGDCVSINIDDLRWVLVDLISLWLGWGAFVSPCVTLSNQSGVDFYTVWIQSSMVTVRGKGWDEFHLLVRQKSDVADYALAGVWQVIPNRMCHSWLHLEGCRIFRQYGPSYCTSSGWYTRMVKYIILHHSHILDDIHDFNHNMLNKMILLQFLLIHKNN